MSHAWSGAKPHHVVIIMLLLSESTMSGDVHACMMCHFKGYFAAVQCHIEERM